MKILTVFCHPIRDSFSGQMLDKLVAGFEASGHEVQIAELYGEGFQPALSAEDYAQFEDRPMPDDVLREQARVEWADAIAFVFPIFWWSFPAMLKGWIDRVFCCGWAWSNNADPEGTLLGERKALVMCLAGSSEGAWKKYGYDEAFRVQMDVGIWSYCGLTDVQTHLFYGINPHTMDDEQHGRYLEEAYQRGAAFS